MYSYLNTLIVRRVYYEMTVVGILLSVYIFVVVFNVQNSGIG